jgi:hypothetical protein
MASRSVVANVSSQPNGRKGWCELVGDLVTARGEAWGRVLWLVVQAWRVIKEGDQGTPARRGCAKEKGP